MVDQVATNHESLAGSVFCCWYYCLLYCGKQPVFFLRKRNVRVITDNASLGWYNKNAIDRES